MARRRRGLDRGAGHRPRPLDAARRGTRPPNAFDAWLTRRRGVVARGASCDWCIADRESDRAHGDISLFVPTGVLDDEAELGYQLVPSARGHGVMREAARLAVAFGLRSAGVDAGGRPTGLGLRRLVAETAADNAASNAVLTGLGFAVSGRDREADALDDGTYADGLHWQLLAHEVRP